MKRFNHLAEELYNVPFATHSIYEGTRHKRKRDDVAFLLDPSSKSGREIDNKKALSYARYLTKVLKTKTWKPKQGTFRRIWSKNRTKAGGKWREIYIPTIDDHIISHMMVHACREPFMKGMHPHCCGSVEGRGIKHILKYVSKWARFDTQAEYFVKLDVRKFFPSITKEGALGVIESKIKDEEMLYLWRIYLEAAPCACPVGYYPSPHIANLYLEDFDHFVEESLPGVLHYLRYSDDMLLIGSSPERLREAVYEIKTYLKERKGLSIKDSWEVKKIGRGYIDEKGRYRLEKGTCYIDMGGYKFSRDVTIMRDGVYTSFKDLVRKISEKGYYSYDDAVSINAKYAWADECDSSHFIRTKVSPQVSIDMTRKVIGRVEKSRKRL